jgi:hypothetical protein
MQRRMDPFRAGRRDSAKARKYTEENFEAFVTPGGLEEFLRSGFPSADEEEVLPVVSAPTLTAATAPQLLAEMMPFLREAVTREAPEPDKVLATMA